MEERNNETWYLDLDSGLFFLALLLCKVIMLILLAAPNTQRLGDLYFLGLASMAVVYMALLNDMLLRNEERKQQEWPGYTETTQGTS